jgi:DNA-binding transcriptional MerR regulator
MNPHQFSRLTLRDAVRLFGLTARALRFYEERGLVQAHRDQSNARYYDAAARMQLEWISRLRAGGIGLADIQEVLTAEAERGRGAQCALTKLAARRRELQRKLALTDEIVASLKAKASRACDIRR